MANSVERYFRLMPSARASRPVARLCSQPVAAARTPDGWLVKIDLAGVRPEEVEITIDGLVLTVAGCRKDSVHTETVAYHQLEITYSRFEKTLRFPCPVGGARLERDYRDGLLILRLRSEQECEEEE